MKPTNFDLPHRRFNALNGSWLQVSPNRAKRPWQGATESVKSETAEYLDDCYLCPGNTRADGAVNPDYTDVFVFDNDFPALLPLNDSDESSICTSNDDPSDAVESELFQSHQVSGKCRVICYSPKHNQHFSSLSVERITRVVDVWAEQSQELGEKYQWVQIFENRGAAMGCSNPHPHGQIWAINSLPTEIEKELKQQRCYFEKHQRPLLLDYLNQERDKNHRVVFENEHWMVCVPYWASWPFETLVLPTKSVAKLQDLGQTQRRSLAQTLKTLCTVYDSVFDTEFPYSMGWHGAPNSYGASQFWQLHAHFYPPLLRSATVKKFMVGYELLAETQRDITPEMAATLLNDKYKQLTQ